MQAKRSVKAGTPGHAAWSEVMTADSKFLLGKQRLIKVVVRWVVLEYGGRNEGAYSMDERFVRDLFYYYQKVSTFFPLG